MPKVITQQTKRPTLSRDLLTKWRKDKNTVSSTAPTTSTTSATSNDTSSSTTRTITTSTNDNNTQTVPNSTKSQRINLSKPPSRASTISSASSSSISARRDTSRLQGNPVSKQSSSDSKENRATVTGAAKSRTRTIARAKTSNHYKYDINGRRILHNRRDVQSTSTLSNQPKTMSSSSSSSSSHSTRPTTITHGEQMSKLIAQQVDPPNGLQHATPLYQYSSNIVRNVPRLPSALQSLNPPLATMNHLSNVNSMKTTQQNPMALESSNEKKAIQSHTWINESQILSISNISIIDDPCSDTELDISIPGLSSTFPVYERRRSTLAYTANRIQDPDTTSNHHDGHQSDGCGGGGGQNKENDEVKCEKSNHLDPVTAAVPVPSSTTSHVPLSVAPHLNSHINHPTTTTTTLSTSIFNNNNNHESCQTMMTDITRGNNDLNRSRIMDSGLSSTIFTTNNNTVSNTTLGSLSTNAGAGATVNTGALQPSNIQTTSVVGQSQPTKQPSTDTDQSSLAYYRKRVADLENELQTTQLDRDVWKLKYFDLLNKYESSAR